MGLAEKSHFVQNLRIHLRKSRILNKSLSKMRQRAASNGAFSRNLYQKCDKGPQVMTHFRAIFIKNATKGRK
jgi:hypothetical protein